MAGLTVLLLAVAPHVSAQPFEVSFDGVNVYATVPDNPGLRITNTSPVDRPNLYRVKSDSSRVVKAEERTGTTLQEQTK